MIDVIEHCLLYASNIDKIVRCIWIFEIMFSETFEEISGSFQSKSMMVNSKMMQRAKC